MNYVLVGYGRMGRVIESEADARSHRLHAKIDRRILERGPTALARSAAGADIAFEFTHAEVAEENVSALLGAGVGVVSGTTGWQPSAALERALSASAAGFIMAPNFSVGVQMFYRLVAEAARMIGRADRHRPYVLEMHHGGKRDVPSGTARRLAEIVVDGDPRLSRIADGAAPAPLPDDTLHVASVRVGHEPGTHEVGFDGPHDRITLRHAARNRAGFALGAVLAGEWLIGKRGRHEFDEVLTEWIGSYGVTQ